MSLPLDWKRLSLRLLVWMLAAAVVTWPVVLHPTELLIGDPRVDVWNHAWGYWYVPHQLSEGQSLFETALAGHPDGGKLYFIDLFGALAWSPVSLLAGPAVAYNGALFMRVALAGWSVQLLAEELGEGRLSGRASWLSGLAAVTLPFLLCELFNGISEVTLLHWAALTLWAASRAARLRTWGSWALLGLLAGFTAASSFYQGLAIALTVGVLAPGLIWQRRAELSWPRVLGGAALTAVVAGAVFLPFWLALEHSLEPPGALISRQEGSHEALALHNGVDPRTYVMPGGFQSVDLLLGYGEYFKHSGYLRWSLLPMAALGLWGRRSLRPWAVGLLASLVLGLGAYVFWDEAILEVGEYRLTLPFDWLRRVLPQVDITHPLRLSVPGQLLVCALAGLGWMRLSERLSGHLGTALLVGGGLLVAAEGLFASAGQWPLATSDARIQHEMYADLPPGGILDLPVEIDGSMLESRYFWLQTGHGRPIPFSPNVDLQTMSDDAFRKAYVRKDAERPDTLSPQSAERLRQRYAAIVLHMDPPSERANTYKTSLEQAFGPPQRFGDDLIFVLK